jgi:hypothetical protein
VVNANCERKGFARVKNASNLQAGQLSACCASNSATVVIPKPGCGTKNQGRIEVDIVPENNDIHDQAQVYRLEIECLLKETRDTVGTIPRTYDTLVPRASLSVRIAHLSNRLAHLSKSIRSARVRSPLAPGKALNSLIRTNDLTLNPLRNTTCTSAASSDGD